MSEEKKDVSADANAQKQKQRQKQRQRQREKQKQKQKLEKEKEQAKDQDPKNEQNVESTSNHVKSNIPKGPKGKVNNESKKNIKKDVKNDGKLDIKIDVRKAFDPKREPKSKSKPTEAKGDATKLTQSKDTNAENGELSRKERKKLKFKLKRAANRQAKRETQREERKLEQLAKCSIPVFKITIRKLPPLLKKESFIEQVSRTYPDFNKDVTSIYYVQGYHPEVQFEESVLSRCYINCTNQETMMKVGRAIKGMQFTDDDGDEEIYNPTIEKSFYQEMPDFEKIENNENSDNTEISTPNIPNTIKIDVWDVFNNKLDEVDVYKRFCEIISDENKKQLPSDIFAYAKKCDAAAAKKVQDEATAKKQAAKKAMKAAKRERRRKRKAEEKAKEKAKSNNKAN